MKRRILAGILAALLCAVLPGCGDGSGAGGSSGGQNAGSASQQAPVDEITVGIAQDLDESLDPHHTVAAGTRLSLIHI